MSLILHRASVLRRAPMFPVIVGADSGNSGGGAATSFALPYVAGEVGDLVIISAAGGSSGSRSLNDPGGWQVLWSHGNFNSDLRVFGGWYRFAPSAGASSVQIGASAAVRWGGVSVRIAKGTFRGVPSVSSSAQGTSGSPNPGSVSAARPGPHLWLAVACNRGANFSASPADYATLGTGDNGGDSNDAATRIARRLLRAASEDPGAFTLSGSANWGARTICIPGWS